MAIQEFALASASAALQRINTLRLNWRRPCVLKASRTRRHWEGRRSRLRAGPVLPMYTNRPSSWSA